MNRRNFLKNFSLLSSGIYVLSKEEIIERLTHKKIYALGSAWERTGILYSCEGKYLGKVDLKYNEWTQSFRGEGLVDKSFTVGKIVVGQDSKEIFPMSLVSGDILSLDYSLTQHLSGSHPWHPNNDILPRTS